MCGERVDSGEKGSLPSQKDNYWKVRRARNATRLALAEALIDLDFDFYSRQGTLENTQSHSA